MFPVPSDSLLIPIDTDSSPTILEEPTATDLSPLILELFPNAILLLVLSLILIVFPAAIK